MGGLIHARHDIVGSQPARGPAGVGILARALLGVAGATLSPSTLALISIVALVENVSVG